jgi:hypothetical protein
VIGEKVFSRGPADEYSRIQFSLGSPSAEAACMLE